MNSQKLIYAIAGAAVLICTACEVERDSANSNVGVRKAEEIAAIKEAQGPLPDSAFKAGLAVASTPTEMKPGEKANLQVKVKNNSDTTWPARGRSSDGYFQVNLGNIWFDDKNTRLSGVDYVRTAFPDDVKPGQEVEVLLNITAPNSPGDYILQIDLVQEMVSWFSDKGNEAPQFKLKVVN